MSKAVAMNENEIVKPIVIRNGDEEYTLDFSRASAVFAQQRGFSPDEVDHKPTIIVPELFFYAMRKNHGNLARNQVDAIRERLFPGGVPVVVLHRLLELYNQASLVNVIAVDEADSKNAGTVVEM